MPVVNGLTLPNPLSNGTANDAVPLMADLNYLLAALNRALLDSGGGAGMNAQSVQIHNLANGTAANDAVNLSQISGFALLSGATFTGPLSGTALALSSSLSVAGGGGITGGLSLGANLALNTNNTTLQFTDANGTHPFFTVDGSNLFSFYGTDGTGASRSILSISMRSGASALTITPSLVLQGNLTASGTLTSGTAANGVGFLGVPSTVKTANYSLVAGDIGQDITLNGASLVLTIPAGLPNGFACTVTNINASNVTITSATDTLTLSGTTTTGNRTLGQNGEAGLRRKNGVFYAAGTALS